MHSKKLNQLLDILNVVSENELTPPSTPFSALSPTQSITDSSCCDVFDMCNIDDIPKTKPKIQYHISVEPIHVPALSNMSSFDSSLPSSSSVSSIPSTTSSSSSSSSSDTCTSDSSLYNYSEVTTPSFPSFDDNIIEPIDTIPFDIDCGKYILSSKGFRIGYHEWEFKVLKSNFSRQEIGVVSVFDPNIPITDYDGIRNNPQFGARSIYGIIPEIKSFYYASYNNDNSCRCNKRLSSYSSWTNGDKIKVCLDLEKATITFMLNDVKVRKSISLQRNVKYYPIVSFSGNCSYQLQ